MLRGKPMVKHVIDRIQTQVDELFINVNRNYADYQAFSLPLLSDKTTDYLGPLAGMVAAMSACKTDYLLSAPCDTPSLPHDLVLRLMQAMQAENALVSVVKTSQGLQSVCCLLSLSLKENLQCFLDSGGRKVKDWLFQHKIVEVDFSDCPACFININSPQQLLTMEENDGDY